MCAIAMTACGGATDSPLENASRSPVDWRRRRLRWLFSRVYGRRCIRWDPVELARRGHRQQGGCECSRQLVCPPAATPSPSRERCRQRGRHASPPTGRHPLRHRYLRPELTSLLCRRRRDWSDVHLRRSERLRNGVALPCAKAADCIQAGSRNGDRVLRDCRTGGNQDPNGGDDGRVRARVPVRRNRPSVDVRSGRSGLPCGRDMHEEYGDDSALITICVKQ